MWSFFSRDAAKDFPYEILEQVNGTEEFLFWKLHKGKKKVCQLIYTAKKMLIHYFYSNSRERLMNIFPYLYWMPKLAAITLS